MTLTPLPIILEQLIRNELEAIARWKTRRHDAEQEIALHEAQLEQYVYDLECANSCYTPLKEAA